MNDSLKSSIKAYCLELMKETSVSDDAGGYLTKKAFRKPKKQDIKSPTGFESSPNPNMYTKTMKFKIVDPNQRLNSKDLWKDLWKEVKINNPVLQFPIYVFNPSKAESIGKLLKQQGYTWSNGSKLDLYNAPFNTNNFEMFVIEDKSEEGYPKILDWSPVSEIGDDGVELNENTVPSYEDFPITISNYEKGQIIGDWLKKYGYKVDTTQPPFTKDSFKPFTLNSDLNKNIKILHEIKINSPGQTQFPIKVNNKGDLDRALKILMDKGFQPDWKEYNGEYPVNIFGDLSSYLFLSDHNGDNEKYNIKLAESRYTQFKRATSKPKPREILHKAIKEIQMKLDEVNRLIEFTTRIKGELSEGEQEIEYLKRTKDSLYKIQDKLKEAFSNISKINEIKINKPISFNKDQLKNIYDTLNYDEDNYNKVETKLYDIYDKHIPHDWFEDDSMSYLDMILKLPEDKQKLVFNDFLQLIRQNNIQI